MKIHNGVLHIIDRHTTYLSIKTSVASLWDALVSAVFSAEVHDSGPIVGKVLRELAGGTSSSINEFTSLVHSYVKRILSLVVNQEQIGYAKEEYTPRQRSDEDARPV